MLSRDLRTELKPYYNPSAKKVERIQVPAFQFIMIDGNIEPGQGPGTSPGFQDAMGALYGAAYTLKFMFKKRKEEPIDYPVLSLEGLWWVEDHDFNILRKDNWFYTVMILQPDFVTPADFQQAVQALKRKKGDQPAFARLRLETFEEGLCLQILHLGPYDTEPATVEKMDDFARLNGLVKRGKHHEIYMGNPLLAAPEKLKTILRHPVEPARPAENQ